MYLDTTEEHQDLLQELWEDDFFQYYYSLALDDIDFIDDTSIIAYPSCKKFILEITIEVKMSAIVWVS